MSYTEEFDGIYVFGHGKWDLIELAPGVDVYVMGERVSLCRTKRTDKQMCFWEGDCEFSFMPVGGDVVITVNDHDEKKGVKSGFGIGDGNTYWIQGHLFQISSDEITQFSYTLYREVHEHSRQPGCRPPSYKSVFTKEIDIETHKMGVPFLIPVYENVTTGYVTEISTDPELEVVDRRSNTSCDEPGCGSTVEYRIIGRKRGTFRIYKRTGLPWDKSTFTTEYTGVRIV